MIGTKEIKKCYFCDETLVVGKNWYPTWEASCIYRCKPCNKNQYVTPNNKIYNPKRMHVNGKYISTKHPLYKAGTYKSFGDAAFSSLLNYTKSKEGEVYVIANKAWSGWVKIGMTVDAEDRLSSYQTSSPYRDYLLLHKVFFADRRRAESTAHSLASEIAKERMNEWFRMSPSDAIKIINSLDNPNTNEVKPLKDNQGYYK